jgi:transposase
LSKPSSPTLARELFEELLDQLGDLDRRIAHIDKHLIAICRDNAVCRRSHAPAVAPTNRALVMTSSAWLFVAIALVGQLHYFYAPIDLR